MSDDRGVYEKYEVIRLDGKGVGECFVLELDDERTWDALMVWANTVEADGNAELANGIRQQVLARMRIGYEEVTP